jgi:hypothetical protein
MSADVRSRARPSPETRSLPRQRTRFRPRCCPPSRSCSASLRSSDRAHKPGRWPPPHDDVVPVPGLSGVRRGRPGLQSGRSSLQAGRLAAGQAVGAGRARRGDGHFRVGCLPRLRVGLRPKRVSEISGQSSRNPLVRPASQTFCVTSGQTDAVCRPPGRHGDHVWHPSAFGGLPGLFRARHLTRVDSER